MYCKKNKHNILRLLALLLVVTMVLAYAPTVNAEGESGSCGANLSWTLSAGTLTITGSGAMTDFPESTMAPWYAQRDEIVRLELPAKLTSIGSLAFYECKNLTAVTIPDSVESIGSYAFAICSGMQMLKIGSKVSSIGESAFAECTSLMALSLPGSLKAIGTKAFYRCESITSVIIPASVTSIGMNAFGYCRSLISADVRASIKTIPEYLFYECNNLTTVSLPDSTSNISDYAFKGCDSLNTVHYDGTDQSLSQIQNQIGSNVPSFGESGNVTDSSYGGMVTTTTTKNDGNGTSAQQNVTVAQGDKGSVSVKVESSNGTTSADISVTIEDEGSWDSAQMIIDTALNEANLNAGMDPENVNVNVYVTDEAGVNSDFVDSMTDRNAQLSIMTQDGSVWKMDGTQLDKENMSGKYDLRYDLTFGTPELCEELETQYSFILKFRESAEVNAEVMIRLGTGWALQQATLFQRGKEGMEKIQTVIVDQEGYAHFFLSSVDKQTEYFIAMNLLSETGEAIVPKELSHAYGNVVDYKKVEYEITGRTSSWGMNINQVTWIMVGVLSAVVIVVGFTMFLLNRRKLRMGYVPDLDEEYDM